MPIFKKGDKVSLKDDAVSGEVISVVEGTLLVHTEEGFEIPLSPEEVVLIPNNSLVETAIPTVNDLQHKTSRKKTVSKRKKPKEQNQPAMEVDLHVHQLVKKSNHMSPHEILTLQLDTAKRQLDFAIIKKIQKVVFIHGVGQGVLRAELEYLFRRYENLNFYDADFGKYGQGAVEVYIYQNKQP